MMKTWKKVTIKKIKKTVIYKKLYQFFKICLTDLLVSKQRTKCKKTGLLYLQNCGNGKLSKIL